MKSQSKLTRLISIALLSSIAYVLMLLEFPFPGLPAFLKIDFSEVPALLAAIIYGPVAGIVVELIKNGLHYAIHNSFTGVPIDQTANFIAGLLFILPTAYIFKKTRTKKGLTMGLIIGSLTMTFMMGVLNYFVILPAYTWFLGMKFTKDAMITLIFTGITPFNLIKSVLVITLFLLLYTKLQAWISKRIQTTA